MLGAFKGYFPHRAKFIKIIYRSDPYTFAKNINKFILYIYKVSWSLCCYLTFSIFSQIESRKIDIRWTRMGNMLSCTKRKSSTMADTVTYTSQEI